jgi:hypothetical protein
MADTLTLHLSEDAFNGDAQFAVLVDGTQIGGPTSVTTAHTTGIFQDFTFNGDFGAGPHSVEVQFLNDAYGGTADTDRNLYVGGITFDGTDYAGETAQNTAMNGQPDADPNAAEMYVNGTVTFGNVTGSTSSGQHIVGTDGDDTLTGGPGDDTIEGLGGNDHLDGQAGADTLLGGTGNDSFVNSAGNDTMTGGAGTDTYTFSSPTSPITTQTGSPTITDFQSGAGGDKVVFDHYADLGPAPSPGEGVFIFDNIYQHLHDLPGGGTELTDGSQTFTFDGISRDDFTPANLFVSEPWFNGNVNGTEGPDTLVVHASEDAWNGDAIMRITVDGHEISGNVAVTTAHGSGGFEDLAFTGNFGDGPHTVGVSFVNDAYGGTPDTDRNLYVGGITFNGTDYPGQGQPNTGAGADTDPNAAEVLSNGTVTFNDVGGSSPPPPSGLVLHVSEDAFNGDAQFVVLVDGAQQGGTLTTTASHSLGQVQDIAVDGTFSAGAHNVEIQFLNDAYGGSSSADRNLYVEGITFNGTDYPGQAAANTAQNGQPDADPNAAEMYINGSVTFNDVGGSSPPPPPSGTTSTIAINVSEDAFQGDAQFNVRVDGAAQIATFTAHASHAAGQSETINITGDFGTQGPGTIDIQFLNDAYGGSPDADRNLYIQSIDVNGVHFQGNTAINDAANGHAADDPSAAVMDIDGTATFHIDHTAPPLMG